MQFALASVIDLTRNFPNADIEIMKRIDFGKHNIEAIRWGASISRVRTGSVLRRKARAS